MHAIIFRLKILLILILMITSVNASFVRTGDNVGLYDIELNQAVVSQTGFETIYAVDVRPSENGLHEVTFSIPKELFDNQNKLKEKEVCEDYFGLTPKIFVDNKGKLKEVDNPEYLNCLTFLNKVETGLTKTVKDKKVDKTITGEVVGQESTILVKLEDGVDKSVKIGDNSIELYFEKGLVDIIVTPETTTDCVLMSFGLYQCNAEFEIVNNGGGQIDVSQENFYADYFGKANGVVEYYVTWEEIYDYNYPIWDNKLLTITDYNVGTATKIDGEWRQIKPFANTVELPNGFTQTYYNNEAWISVKSGEVVKFRHRFFTSEDKGKYDFYFFYDGSTYYIDPYWTANFYSSDLQHNFDFNGWVRNSPQLLPNAWTSTGELDWNVESVNTSTSGGWGELAEDFNIQEGNLTGLWHLNNNANDSVGSNNGTWYGGEAYNTGLWDTNSGVFNGTNNRLMLSNSSILNTNAFTFSAWVYNAGGGSTIYSEQASASSSVVLSIRQSSFYIWSNPSTIYSLSTPLLSENKWTNVVATFSTTTGMRVYFDGVLVASNAAYTSPPTSSRDNSALGAREAGAGNWGQYWNGRIEEVGMWDVVLSASEIEQLYEEQKGSWLDANLMAYYKFNEVSGTTIYDSARANDGTLENGANINHRGLWDTNALNLDGSNDTVDISSNTRLTQGTPHSVMGWIRPENVSTTSGRTVFASGTGASSNRIGMIVRDNSLAYGIYNGSSYVVAESGTIRENIWQHFAVIYNGSTADLYINGVLQSGSLNPFLSLNNFFVIGSDTSKLTKFFQGEIEEFKIYDDVLSYDEVIADYNSFLNAKFVDANIVEANYLAQWETIKINSDVNYDFGTQICGASDDCDTDIWNNDLVGLWHLNGNATDSSGNGLNGTASGVSVTSGLWNTNAYDFSSSDYIQINNSFNNSYFTVSMWVKRSNSANDFEAIFSNVDGSLGSGSTDGFYIWSRGTSVNSSYYGLQTPGDALLVTTGSRPSNVWDYVVFTYNNGIAKAYVNGVDSSQGAGSGSITNTSESFARLGASAYSGLVSGFTGNIEEFVVWDRVLSPTEVADLYRKYSTKLDLNVYSCSEVTCSTKTSSYYITDANNNYDMNIASLNPSKYFGFESYFKPINELLSYTAGYFHTNSFLQDVNVNYRSDANVFNITFNILDADTGTPLTNVNADFNDNLYDWISQNSPHTIEMLAGDYNAIFSQAVYDTNSIVFTADSDKNIDVYLSTTKWTQTFYVLDSETLMDLTFDVDFNIDLYDHLGITSPHDINMANASYQGIFTATGYDSNTFNFAVNMQENTWTIYLTKSPIIEVEWINPPYQGTTSSLHTYFIVTQGGENVDFNLFFNGVDINALNYCSGLGTIQAICNTTSILYVPNSYNDFNVVGQLVHIDNNFYYNPNKDDVIPNNDTTLILIGLIILALILMIKRTKQ